ncbi:MAG: septation protein IspZ [Sphingomonas bacterium]|nr:septation protein IspZ [Sphingomonas bacterium]
MDAPTAPGRHLWRYERSFSVPGHAGLVLVDARMDGLFSSLRIDGVDVAHDSTPPAGPQAVRNHRLVATLPDGREIAVDAGFISMVNVGIAVRLDGAIVHESHPGRRIAFPARAASRILAQSLDGKPAYDVDKLKRNKVPIIVDIATGLLFFLVAKLTDLRTAALIGASVGIALVVVQRFVKVDLIGGLALFGILMMLVSAGLAIAFEDDAMIKQRSTIVGLLGAALFLFDGLVLKGRRLGRGISRYIAYSDIDEARMAIGAGLTGLVMAAANWLVARHFSTDVWLFYTTFGDFALAIGLILLAVRWARRKGNASTPAV